MEIDKEVEIAPFRGFETARLTAEPSRTGERAAGHGEPGSQLFQLQQARSATSGRLIIIHSPRTRLHTARLRCFDQ